MAVGRLLINGIDRSKWVQFKTVSIEASTVIKGSSLSFEMMIPHFKQGDTYQPEIPPPRAGNVVILEVYRNEDWNFEESQPRPNTYPASVEFGGTIQTVQKEMLAPPSHFKYSCSAHDWTAWLDRRLVSQAFGPVEEIDLEEELEKEGEEKAWSISLRDMILQLVSDHCQDPEAVATYGPPAIIMETPGYENWHARAPGMAPFFSVAADETTWTKLAAVEVGARRFEYLRLSEIFNDLCESTGFQWYVDAYRRIIFLDKVSGFIPPVGKFIYEQRPFETDPERIAVYSDLKITDDVSDVRNCYYFGNIRAPGAQLTELITVMRRPWWTAFFRWLDSVARRIWTDMPSWWNRVIELGNKYHLVTEEAIREQIELWVIDMIKFNNENDPETYAQVEPCIKRKITDFHIVRSPYNVAELRAQSKKAFYCVDTRELIVSDDLVDWETEGLAITGRGFNDSNTVMRIDVHDAIMEMMDREKSCGEYHEYFDAGAFPRSWTLREQLARLAERAAYPKFTGSFISFVPGWAPGQKLTFVGNEIWKSNIEFYVMSTRKSFTNERVMKTEVALSTNLYKGR